MCKNVHWLPKSNWIEPHSLESLKIRQMLKQRWSLHARTSPIEVKIPLEKKNYTYYTPITKAVQHAITIYLKSMQPDTRLHTPVLDFCNCFSNCSVTELSYTQSSDWVLALIKFDKEYPQCLISLLTVHQIFLLVCNWSKHIMWLNIPQLKLWNIREYTPIFETARVAKKI